MAESRTMDRFSYELPIGRPVGGLAGAEEPRSRRPGYMSAPVLIENAVWFCWLRWVAVLALAAFGVAAQSDGLMRQLGLTPPGPWLWVAAAVLAVANSGFTLAARALRREVESRRTVALLWAQIILDLLVLTAVVHFVGSMTTFVAFTYLFHIVLTCIFFRRMHSLAVMLLAVLLFTVCILAEQTGLLSATSIMAVSAGRPQSDPGAEAVVLHVLSVISIWLVVWYVASHLSVLVRGRDVAVDATNRRLLAAMAERSRHMLTTTHQLKAPFAAVQSNAQLLLKGYCGPLSDEANAILERISVRCAALNEEIQEMLQLANLRSTSQHGPPGVEVDLADLLRWAIEQVRPAASGRGIVFETDLEPAHATVAEDHQRMLVTNLLSNAAMYSHEGGRVIVQCRQNDRGEAVVMIADEGIGIAPEKVPRIFEEHFRTSEAVRHNKHSSGLGLAIVGHIVDLYGIHLTVTSTPGRGTTFELQFAPSGAASRVPATGEKQWRIC